MTKPMKLGSKKNTLEQPTLSLVSRVGGCGEGGIGDFDISGNGVTLGTIRGGRGVTGSGYLVASDVSSNYGGRFENEILVVNPAGNHGPWPYWFREK